MMKSTHITRGLLSTEYMSRVRRLRDDSEKAFYARLIEMISVTYKT